MRAVTLDRLGREDVGIDDDRELGEQIAADVGHGDEVVARDAVEHHQHVDVRVGARFAARLRSEEARVAEVFAQSRVNASGGGDFYLNQPFRIGEKLSRAVLGEVREGGTSYTEAFRLLGLRNADQLSKYAAQLGV